MNAEPETYPHEALADEEPRYLRRQKPLAVRRRKFNRKSWSAVRRWLVAGVGIAAAGWLGYAGIHFLLFSPRLRLDSYDQIEVAGTHYVGRDVVIEKFAADRGRSILRVPLDARRAALEAIPWVGQASVERALPNGIRVEIVERTPVAFLRDGYTLELVDSDGVILDRPVEGDFAFPVVSGLGENMPAADRRQRMQLFGEFLKDIDLAEPGASERVSEVDLSDAQDVRATLGGLGDTGEAPLLVRFGDSDFVNKYRLLLENIADWRANVGRVESVDLRFSRQVVVNPEGNKSARAVPPSAPAIRP